jgi:hypothetical protein
MYHLLRRVSVLLGVVGGPPATARTTIVTGTDRPNLPFETNAFSN